MPIKKVLVNTEGERFYEITQSIKNELTELCADQDGIIYLFIQHTSCALTINESYDPLAKEDMQEFLKHIAPRDLAFIKHDDEGPDDSPSHMKSMLLSQHLALPVEKGNMLLGTWQGIFLAEFRDAPKNRTVILKFIKG